MRGSLAITGDPDADELLNTDPFALVLGMLLDQQVPMEWAFRGPATVHDRLGHLDPARLAALDPEDLVAVFAEKPAVHRFPASMARRAHQLSQYVVDELQGDVASLWSDTDDARVVVERLRGLPGYGDEKSKILVAILVKRMDVDLDHFAEAAGPFADATPRSAADVDGPETLAEVRSWKKQQKAAGRSKQD